MPKHRTTLRLSRPALSVAVVALAALAGCGKQSHVDAEQTASLIQPVARVELQAVTIKPGTRTGEQIYKSTCGACHEAGVVGAPKMGDSGGWAPRVAIGENALVASAIAGKNAMPPRGGGSDLTDAEVHRAVAYIVNHSGGSFTEPPIEQ